MTSLEQSNVRQALRAEREWCRACGQTIDAISPTWFTVERHLKDPKRPRGQICYDPDNPDDPALCVPCSVAAAATDRRAAWEGFLASLVCRKQQANVPNDVTLFHHKTRNSHVFPRTQRVHQTDFYFIISRDPINPEWNVPTESFKPDNGNPPMTLIYVGADLRLDGVATSMSVTWDAEALGTGQSEMKINGWGEASHDDVMRLMDGARWLWEEAGPWRGRPRGSLDRSEAMYFDMAEAILTDGEKLTLECLAARFSTDAKRVRSNLKHYKYEWLTFKAEAERRAMHPGVD